MSSSGSFVFCFSRYPGSELAVVDDRDLCCTRRHKHMRNNEYTNPPSIKSQKSSPCGKEGHSSHCSSNVTSASVLS
jgi:hypothetical protein